MKKCPYCAEEIKDEAIVCRYCGRDLLDGIEAKSRQITPAEGLLAAWKQGAKASAILTILYEIGSYFVSSNSDDYLNGLVPSIVFTFFGWWLICAFFVWVWRKLGNNTIVKIIFAVTFMTVLILLSNFLSVSTVPVTMTTWTPSPLSTQTPYQPLVSTIKTISAPQFENCVGWDEIDSSDFGFDNCVYGIVNQVEHPTEEISRFFIFFGNDTDFYLLDVNYDYPDVKVGDCVSASGMVSRDTKGVLYIFLSGGRLQYCE